MPKCVDCKYEGKYSNSKIPFETVVAYNFGVPANVSFVGFEEEVNKHGFDKDDLAKKAMHCRAPGGGPTRDPIWLIQALGDQPCSYFSPKEIGREKPSRGKEKKWWAIWK
jgi:hypothetical protein